MQIYADPWAIPPPPGHVSAENMNEFQEGCRTTAETLKAAIREIEDFGVYEEQPKPAPAKKGRSGNGGVTQTFHANTVTIQHQAIATGQAIQKIEHMGDETIGASLNEIADLLQQSEELSRREVREGLAQIEAVAIELKKPEAKRDWKAVLKGGEAILTLTDKATDLAKKIAPYTPVIAALVHQAERLIK